VPPADTSVRSSLPGAFKSLTLAGRSSVDSQPTEAGSRNLASDPAGTSSLGRSIDDDLDIVTPDGMMNTLATHPEEGGPYPVVLFYMDAAGKREELHDMARRIGTASYYVMLPNLYHRDERDFDATSTRPWTWWLPGSEWLS